MRNLRCGIGRTRAALCAAAVMWGAGGLAGAAMSGHALGAPAADERPRVSAAKRQMMYAQLMLRGTTYEETGQPIAAACFVEDPTPEQFESIMERFQALPPPLATGLTDRYFTAGTVWVGNGQTGQSGRAAPASLTYSFPADGVSWGDGNNGPVAPNDLNANLVTLFGDLDRGREYIRQGLASWRRVGGLSYTEVADDGAPFATIYENVSTRGNVRIGSNAQGTSGVLAYNYFPGASDMAINSSEFAPSRNTLARTSSNFRYFRNVIAHEHGHGLGYIHPTPCNETKLMEPFLSTNFDMTQIDEFRGIGRNYGDRFAGNNSGAAARDFGDLTLPSLRSVVQTNLSTNGTTGFNNSDEDWFRFTLSSAQSVVISATPLGGSYANGQQTSGCNPSSPGTINASAAGNLNIELRTGTNGGTVNQTAASAAAGTTETLNAGTLAPGTYWVRVFDVGPNGSQNVQLYSLAIRAGAAKAPPTAIAGLNKRVQADTTAHFMGNINSSTNDTTGPSSATITAYSWDLNGDGVFEIGNSATTTATYVSNGVFPVTLRVTDSNALTADDTINVTVFGATTAVSSVAPTSGNTGQTVAVTISGRNFKGVVASSQVTVSGVGVGVTGTPVVNAAGTQISGLSLVINAGAALGSRNITVSNSDGAGASATGVALFTVNSGACVPVGIAGQPTPTTGCIGGSASFTVTASGSAPYSYQWQRDSVDINGATGATLTLNPVGSSDAAAYRCIVTNACGSTPSGSASLTVNTPVAISQDPSPVSVCVGQPATFSVSATGVPAPTFQWRKGMLNIGGATSSILSIASVTTGDAGSYTCVVTNACGSQVSAAAALSVATAPSIAVPPQSVTVCEDGATSLSLTPAGGGPFTYQWRRNGQNLAGAFAVIYSISSVVPEDAGIYDCIVTNLCDSTISPSAEIVVVPYPTVTSPPAPAQVCAGQPASFTVAATGAAPITFQWRRNGVSIGGATGATYQIAAAASADQGSYDCLLTGPCGTIPSPAAALTVNEAPTITTQPLPQTVCEDSPAVFSIVATGSPGYQWRLDGVNIDGATSATLTIPSATSADAGSYDCVLTSTCDPVPSAAVLLVVDPAPTVQTQPEPRTACIGDDVSFSVVIANAQTYQWRRGPLTLTDGVTGSGSVISGATAATLTISDIDAADTGEYTCDVVTPCGPTSTLPALLTIDSGVQITGQPIGQSSCRGGAVTLSVVATGAAPVTYQWRKDTMPIDGATSPTLELTDLRTADQASYDCIVTDDCDSVTSDAATLSICAADFNCSGVVSVQDIFDFLAGYFADAPLADVNESGVISVQDIFDFLAAYFAGCA